MDTNFKITEIYELLQLRTEVKSLLNDINTILDNSNSLISKHSTTLNNVHLKKLDRSLKRHHFYLKSGLLL